MTSIQPETKRRVAIVHPWLPQYRVPLFCALSEKLEEYSIDIDFYYGVTPPEWAARGDTAAWSGADCLPTRFLRVGSRYLIKKDVSRVCRGRGYDLVVLEHAIRNLESYRLLIDRKRVPRVAWWGHGKEYTKDAGRAEAKLKEYLVGAGDWFFAYTPGGAAHVESLGFPATRVSVLYNSIDTESLRADCTDLAEEEIQEFVSRHDLRGSTGLYVGGLDEAKRIQFLVESALEIADRNPNFRLLIAGAGTLQPYVEEVARGKSFIDYVGPLFGRDKALALSSCELILNPGRVGLIAVDSLVAGIPIVTLSDSNHAPEFEYLRDARNCGVVDGGVEEYVRHVEHLLFDRTALSTMKRHCLIDSAEHSVERTAEIFARGISEALCTESRPSLWRGAVGEVSGRFVKFVRATRTALRSVRPADHKWVD